MKTVFNLKTRVEVSPADQAIFDASTKQLGFVPNMYRIIANSENALHRYVKAEFDKTSLTTKEQEIVNLVVSEVNKCAYCTSFHYSYLLKMGYTPDELAAVRKGGADFDSKLDALIKFSKSITEKRGHIDRELIDELIAAGYNQGTVIDTILLVNLRGVTNYVYAAIGDFDIDFPAPPELV